MYATCDVLHSWCDVFDTVAGMTYKVDVIEVRTGFKLDRELYRYRYIETPFIFSRRTSQISAFSRNPKLCGIQYSASPPHATIVLPQAVIQKMESHALK